MYVLQLHLNRWKVVLVNFCSDVSHLAVRHALHRPLVSRFAIISVRCIAGAPDVHRALLAIPNANQLRSSWLPQ